MFALYEVLYLLPPAHTCSGAIVMKECDAYGEINITGTDHIYATPHAYTTPHPVDRL